MPLIEYQCPACGHKEERLYKGSSRILEQVGPCDKCGCIYMDKIISILGYRRDQTIYGEKL